MFQSGLHQPFMVGEAFAVNDEVLRHERIKIPRKYFLGIFIFVLI
jgi:hypothetical protein